MNVYATDHIRNVALMGHGGSGKTTLAESMANLTGMTSRMGNVTDGNTISDFDKEEIKRGFSISTSIIPIEWNKFKINVLDTPGYFDFVGQVEEAAGVADAAVICISAKDGVQVGSQKAWRLCEKNGVPRIFFVTGMDNNDINYQQILDDLNAAYGTKVVPLHLPIFEGGKCVGYADVVKKTGHKFGDKGAVSDCPVPDDIAANLDTCRDALIESVAESSEEMMERYFGGEEFTVDEIEKALAQNVADCSSVLVTLGAPTLLQGVSDLLNNIVTYFPDPGKRTKIGKRVKNDEEFAANYDASKEKTAFVWKTMVDPFIGKYNFIKVCSGTLKADDALYDSTTESESKIGKLYVLTGNKPAEVPELAAGDIGALAKMNDVSTGDTLSMKANPVVYEKTEISEPFTYKRYSAVKKGDEDKIAQSLARLAAEDQTIRIVQDAANRQSLLYGMGDQHLDIIVSKLKERYKAEVELSEPKVAFRETILKTSDVEGKHKKQTGGHGQYGHVKMKFSPSGDMSKPYEFEITVVGGTVPKNYYPAVEKGLNEAVLKGPLAAYPVVGVKANLYDGSYHPVDSSEQAFKTATHLAFKDGFLKAGPVLLEPIVTLKVTVNDKFTGDVMGDLNKRRGRVLGMNPNKDGDTVVEAEVPQMELYGYGTILRSMTGGSGDFSYEFARYEQAPADIQEKQIKLRADELAEDDE